MGELIASKPVAHSTNLVETKITDVQDVNNLRVS